MNKTIVQIIREEIGRMSNLHTDREIKILKFGGTTVGSIAGDGGNRIRSARILIQRYIDEGFYVVPVFSAYRRGRSADNDNKISITDILYEYRNIILGRVNVDDGVKDFRDQLRNPHDQLIKDLELDGDRTLLENIESEIEYVVSTALASCRCPTPVRCLQDDIVTSGERFSIVILSAYLNKCFKEEGFSYEAAPATALEMGLTTDDEFGSANIDWFNAANNVRREIIGIYLENNIIPIVSGFDGIYDPSNEFKKHETTIGTLNTMPTKIFRTCLGRGGSDLTATFLGAALQAKSVDFIKETEGVLTCDDLIAAGAATTIPYLSYELAMEAGNLLSKAVNPVEAQNIRVLVYDVNNSEKTTEIGGQTKGQRNSHGPRLIQRPKKVKVISVGAIPDEPGSLLRVLHVLANEGVNLSEIRHEKSKTIIVVDAGLENVHKAVEILKEDKEDCDYNDAWMIRLVGQFSLEDSVKFNERIHVHRPITYAAFGANSKVLTATINSISVDEERMHYLIRSIHEEFVLPGIGGEDS